MADGRTINRTWGVQQVVEVLTSSPGSPLLPSPTAQSFGTMSSGYRDADNPGVKRASLEHMVRHPDDWISSSEDSPVSQSPPPAAARPRTITAGYGPSSRVSFASLDPDGSWLKTSPDSSVQATLMGPLLERFSGTWPKQGSMHAGQVFAHPTLVRPTVESGSSYLQTPATVNRKSERAMRSSAADGGNGRRSGKGQSSPPGLEQQVEKLLPTPDTMPDAYANSPRMAANFETGHAVSLGQRMVHLHTPTTGDTNPSYDHRASPGYTRKIPVPNLAAQVDELLPTPRHEGFDAGNHRRSLGEPMDQPSSDGSES
jgi:hypothetical protein